MDEEKKIGYVTDVDKNNLSETVKEKNLSDEIFEKFDQEIEDSFQKFLQELKSNLTGKEKPEDLQERFNEWLEKNIAQLDELMEDNIAIQVVKDSELKLVGFNTVNEILNLEDEVEAEQKNKTKETVEVEIKGDQLKMTTFNNINPNAIAKLFNENNFKKEDELLNLLKTAKRKKDYSSDEVRKFQRIIVGIEDPDSNAEDPKYKGNDSPLKRYGIDGKFGKETLEAFEQYVKKYPENTNSGTGAQGSEQTETGTQIIGGGTPKVGVGTPGIDQQETGEKGPVTTTTETETSNTDMEFLRELSDKTALDEDLAKEILEKGNNQTLTLQNLNTITPEGAKIIKDYKGTLILTHLNGLPTDILKTLWEDGKVTIEFNNGRLKTTTDGNRVIEMKDINADTHNDPTKITQDLCNLLIDKATKKEPVKKKERKKKDKEVKNDGTPKNDGQITKDQTETFNQNPPIEDGTKKGPEEELQKQQQKEQTEDPKIAKFERKIGERTSLDKDQAKEIIETLGEKRENINLPKLESISKEAAEELKAYNGKLVVRALTELPLDVIQTFWDNSKTTIEFENGKLITKDDSRIIETNNPEGTYKNLDKIDTKVCNLLIGKPTEEVVEEVVEQPVVETPVVETPVVETPVVETPVVETPVVETPVVETPVVETPVVETPVVETPVVETTEEGGKMSKEEINELFEYLKGATEGISEEEFSNLIQSLESSDPECITMLKDGKIQSLQKKYAGDTYAGALAGEVISRTAGLPQFGINGKLNQETYNLLLGIDDINDANSIKGSIKSPMFVDEKFNLRNEIIKNDDNGNYIQVQGQKYYEAKDGNISGLYYKKTDNSFELGYFENGKLNGRGIKSEYNGKIIEGTIQDWNTDSSTDNTEDDINKPNQNNNIDTPEQDPTKDFQQQINDWPTLNTDQANEIMEKLRDQGNIRLDKLEGITEPVANILKDYKNTLIVNGLKVLSPEVLKIFWDSGTTIEFKKGNLKTIDGSHVIADKEGNILCNNINAIDGKLCESLISKDVEENGENNGHGNDSHTENNDNNNGQEELKKQTAKSSIQYRPSKTLEDTEEDTEYEKKYENAKNEKEAIRLLLGLKGFKNQTDDSSIGIKGYDIKKLKLSGEANNLRALKNSLEFFLDLDDTKKTSALFDAFNSIYDQYHHEGKRFKPGIDKDSMISPRNMKNYGNYVELDENGNVKNSDENFSKGFRLLALLYQDYQDGTGGAYFNNVMGLLEVYFVHGGIRIEDLKEGESIFEKIFNENNYGTIKGEFDLDKKKTDFDNTKGSNDEIRYNNAGEKEFVEILSDFNLDGRLDNNDRGTSSMGLELKNIYASTNIDFQNSDLSDQIESDQSVWKNIVNFAINYFENMGDSDMANKLKSVNSIEDLNTKLKEKDEGKYKTLVSLQEMLKTSPVPISLICRYGNKAPEMFFNELMNDEEFNEMYNREFDKLIQQGVDPNLRIGLKPSIYASYVNGGLGGGGGVAYETKNIGTLSLELGATHVPGSNELQYGIVMGWQPKKEFKVGKGKVKLGINAGYSTYEKHFLAVGTANYISGIRNEKKLQAIDADHTRRATVGLNIGYVGGGLYLSAKTGAHYDYIEGISEMTNRLNKCFRDFLSNILDDEKFNTFFTNGQFDTSKSEELKGYLEEKLTELGKKEDSRDINKDVIKTMIENIYSGLMYFSAGLKFDEKDKESFETSKKLMINQIAETYTHHYISNHIDKKIDGKRKLTDISMGPAIVWDGVLRSSIAKSAYYSVVGSVGLTKFGNTYMEETDASVVSHETRLATGLGLDYLEASVDKDGYITEDAIKYLNEKLSIVGTKFGKLERHNDEKYILIPKDLCRSINIWIDPSVKEYITSTETGFKIPLNTEIALLTHSGTNSTQFELVIGDNKTDSQDRLSPNLELTGKDTAEYEPKKEGKMKFDIAKINENISEFTTRNTDFPLKGCEFTTTGKFAFIQQEGAEITIDDNLSIDENQRIVLPSHGKLIIRKGEDGKYKASFESGNEKKITIVYDDGTTRKLLGEGIKVEKVFENEKTKELNKIFDDIEDKLSKMDDSENNSGKYASFMNAAANLGEGVDDILDKDDVDIAFTKLKDLIYNKLNEDIFDVLKQRFDDPDISTQEKAMIIDKFKAVFSYNDQIINTKGLENQLKKRGTRDTYKKLHGYDETIKFPLTSNFDYRKAVKDKLTEMGEFKRELNTDLIGMTAFYRLGQNEKGRSYMMTELGGTYVLGDVKVPISESDIEDTKNWFTKNLEKSGVHKEILRKSLSEKIKSILKLKELDLKEEDIMEILLGNSIDIGGKKYKINTKYVFYLLGECANESIGVEIGNIKLDDSNGGGEGDGENGGDTLIIEPDETNEGKYGVYVGSTEAKNRTVVQAVGSIGAGVMAGPEGKKGHDHESTGPENIHNESTGPENIHNDSTGVTTGLGVLTEKDD